MLWEYFYKNLLRGLIPYFANISSFNLFRNKISENTKFKIFWEPSLKSIQNNSDAHARTFESDTNIGRLDARKNIETIAY